jgi:iron complex outermembrane receptor protein
MQVLRGPQGILFGRNVTGGAVLINTRKPTDEFEVRVRGSVDGGGDGGLNSSIMGSVGGPLTDNFKAKITAHYRDDEGWFENQFDGKDFGASEQKLLRPTLLWTPSDDLEMTLVYEYADLEGDGPASQTHTNGSGVPGSFINFKRDSHDFSVDEPGFGESETHLVSFEINWAVGDNGTITNILGYRDYDAKSLSDIDAQPVWLFHAPAWLEAEQVSNELRYNAVFADRANVTTGIYYFNNELDYHERRELVGIATGGVAPAAQFDGGGIYEVETYAVFGAVDYDLSERWTLTAGLRYTYEEKDAEIASLSQNINTPCNIVEPSASEPVCPFDFVDSDDWDSWSPKLGATWRFTDNARLYAHWTRGYRSGGYNLRNTSFNPADVPGPFDQEEVNNYEVGMKAEFTRGRLNASLFYNEIEDMQRELNLPSQGAGVIQLVRNTADANILGFEVDGTFGLTENLLVIASVGWLDPEYDKVFFDLNGDGVIDRKDEKLDLPRAAELTYTIGLHHDLEIGNWGYLSSRISYSYRDESAYTDNNLGFILEQERLDMGFDLHTNDGRWTFSLYGRNLTDEVLHGGDTQLPDDIGGVPTGGTFSPLAKGRVYGAEITFNL